MDERSEGAEERDKRRRKDGGRIKGRCRKDREGLAGDLRRSPSVGTQVHANTGGGQERERKNRMGGEDGMIKEKMRDEMRDEGGEKMYTATIAQRQ